MSSRTRDALLSIDELGEHRYGAHRSHQIDEEDVEWADVILASEADHVRFVRAQFADARTNGATGPVRALRAARRPFAISWRRCRDLEPSTELRRGRSGRWRSGASTTRARTNSGTLAQAFARWSGRTRASPLVDGAQSAPRQRGASCGESFGRARARAAANPWTLVAPATRSAAPSAMPTTPPASCRR